MNTKNVVIASIMVIFIVCAFTISYKRLYKFDNIQYWKQAVHAEPKSIKNRWTYATELYDSGNIKAAEIEYRSALKLDPKSSSVKYSLGALLFKSGRHEEARNYWQSIVDTGQNKSLIKKAKQTLDISLQEK